MDSHWPRAAFRIKSHHSALKRPFWPSSTQNLGLSLPEPHPLKGRKISVSEKKKKRKKGCVAKVLLYIFSNVSPVFLRSFLVFSFSILALVGPLSECVRYLGAKRHFSGSSKFILSFLSPLSFSRIANPAPPRSRERIQLGS